jgi:vacuolar-type H+-ATPase subunit H
MSLESILDHIINEANQKREKIIQAARIQAEEIIKGAEEEAKKLYQDVIAGEKAICENQKRKLIVSARLENKNNYLAAKQELIESVFEKLKSTLGGHRFKKQQVTRDKVEDVAEDTDFYLAKLRLDYETEIAKILFD